MQIIFFLFLIILSTPCEDEHYRKDSECKPCSLVNCLKCPDDSCSSCVEGYKLSNEECIQTTISVPTYIVIAVLSGMVVIVVAIFIIIHCSKNNSVVNLSV